MIEGRVIRGVDLRSPTFIRCLVRLKDPQLLRQVKATLQSLLLLDIDQAPAKLHMHQLKSKQVPSRCDPSKKVSAWTLHVTPDDRYKASFTFEDGMAYFRLCDEHDVIDKNP